MIVVDTSVVSEMMRASPEQPAIVWLNRQETAALYLSTISLAGIGYGLRAMPDGNAHDFEKCGLELINPFRK